MGLDIRYVLAPSLEMYFVSKDTGLPLINGAVYFYEDNARTIPKDVYQISGSPPNYGYSVLPNPSLLSAVGTFQDANGDDILPYYYPYDASGNIDLYYIEVYDQNGVLQFTREGWPNTVENGTIDGSADVTNYVPNGQFLLHDNIPATSANNNMAGELSQDITTIAPGGWTFERGPSSTATDFVTFPEYTSPVEIPSGNPRYAVEIATTIAGTDTRKDLCLTFRNVNTFASTTQTYNFYFEGEALSGGSVNCQIIVRKFFGTGGSPSATTETVIDTVALIENNIQKFNTEILFGSNAGSSLGTNNDDYVQIAVRVPPTSVQTVLMTDFALTIGSELLTAFPQQTEAQQIDASLGGWLPVPDPNGFDLYCPTVLGLAGLLFDHSPIGTITAAMRAAVNNELACDGSQYLTAGYSSLGIPYARLQKVLFQSSYGLPVFGTGDDFVNTYISAGVNTELLLATNLTQATQTVPADGSPATSFTFNTYSFTATSSTGYNAFTNNLGRVTAVSTFSNGTHNGNNANAGTSGMIVTSYGSGTSTVSLYGFVVESVAASALSNTGSAGLYFTYSNHSTDFYVWFFQTNETDPAPGGTGIKISMNASWTAADIGIAIAAAIGSTQYNSINIGALPPAGSNFTFNANGVAYTVWYSYDAAVAPVTANMLIPVVLTGSESAAQVTTKTQVAINSVYFAVPDLRGMFLRGVDPFATWDIDQANRYGYSLQNSGAYGTFQLDQIISHTHGIGNVAPNGSSTPGSTGSGDFTAATGGVETRPVNATVNWFIKY